MIYIIPDKKPTSMIPLIKSISYKFKQWNTEMLKKNVYHTINLYLFLFLDTKCKTNLTRYLY